MIPLAAIETPTVQWSLISPELILLGASCFLLLAGSLISGRAARLFCSTVALLAFGGAALAAILLWDHEPALAMAGQLQIDRFTEFVRIIVCGAGMLAVATSWGTRRLDERISEYYALLLSAGAGMGFLAASNGFVTLFVALELFSISLYVLCALDVWNVSSLESGLKYLIIGSVGSAFLLFGAALTYGGTGSLRFDEIAQGLAPRSDEALLLFGIAMVIAGLAFKASLAPFHMWTPDVYEGAPTPVTSFMATATKTVALAVMLRVLVTAFEPSSETWMNALSALAVISMVLGNVVAFVQTNAKRMLAYSSIGHAGYLLIAVIVHTEASAAALVFYLAVYSAMSLGAFAVVIVRERELGGPVGLAEMAGWGYARPWLSAAWVLFMLSLASFPPTGGFLAKFYLFSAAIEADRTWLAIVGVAATVLSLAYYLRWAAVLFQRPAEGIPRRRAVPGTVMAGLATAIAAALVIWLGLAPEPVVEWAQEAAASLAVSVAPAAAAAP